MPLEQKLPLKLNENNIGYLPTNASVQGASTVHKATKPNQNESFFVSHDRGPEHPDVLGGKPLRGRNQWPPALPDIRADMMAYFEALRAMCDRMLPPFAVALGLPGDFFAPFFADEAHAVVRFLHYPPQETAEDNTFGQAPHTDNSFMTALARTDCSWARGQAAMRQMVRAAGHPGNFSDQSRQYHAPLVERSFSVDAARGSQRVGDRSVLDRLLPQPQPQFSDRVRTYLRYRRQSATLPARSLS
jgi:hypothetical protein